MGLFDKIRNFAFAGEDVIEDDDYYTSEYEEDDVVDSYKNKVEDIASARERKRAATKISEFSQTTTAQTLTHVKITKPMVVDDGTQICNYLKSNNICVVILEGVENAEAQRIADFLGGATYALGGNIRRLSPSIFMIAPQNVSFSEEDLKEQLKSTGLSFPSVSALFR